MSRIFKKRVYIHPEAPRHFDSERDARGWCADHGKDPTVIMGFDSTAEWKRWNQLRDMERNGEICDLRRQVPFTLVPKQTHTELIGKKEVPTYFVTGLAFMRKADAQAYCRKHGLPAAAIGKVVNDVPKFKEVVDELPVTYVADFVYYQDGEQVVEDCKSDFTRKEKDYIIKRKLMLHKHHIKIYEYITK